MTQYVLTMYQPDEGAPEPDELARIMAELGAIEDDIRAAGAWVFSGALHPASAATVIRAAGDDVLMTDGPYVEGKEHIGGFTIVDAPDLDVALGWARRMTQVTTLPIEVRPFQGG